MRTLKTIIKKNNLNLIYVFRNLQSVFWMFLFLFIAWALIVVLLPIQYSGAQLMFVSIYLLVIMGSISYQWSNSTLNENENILGLTRTKHYLSLLLTIFIIGNIMSLFLFAGNAILNELNLVLNDFIFAWEHKKEDTIFYWNQFEWWLLFYAIQINILVTFSIYFVSHRFLSCKKSYYNFIIVVLLVCFIFGSGFNDYFFDAHHNYYNGPVDLSKNVNLGFKFEKGVFCFPISLFIPTSILVPFYNTFQFYGTTIQSSLVSPDNILSNSKSWTPFLFAFNTDHWQWSLVLIMPYIHIAIFTIIGLSSHKIKSLKK